MNRDLLAALDHRDSSESHRAMESAESPDAIAERVAKIQR